MMIPSPSTMTRMCGLVSIRCVTRAVAIRCCELSVRTSGDSMRSVAPRHGGDNNSSNSNSLAGKAIEMVAMTSA